MAPSPPATRPASTMVPPPWSSWQGNEPTSSAWRRSPACSRARQRAWTPSSSGPGPFPGGGKVRARTGLTVDGLELIEANEAFAAQALAVARSVGFRPELTNVSGGAIALGHPIGASGCRILVTLVYGLRRLGRR